MMKKILTLILAVTLFAACCCPAAMAAGAKRKSNQPFFYTDQEAFLTWYGEYEPDAAIKWDETWQYVINLQKDGGTTLGLSANLSADQAFVQSGRISCYSGEITDEALEVLRSVCAGIGDSFSEEDLQAVRQGENSEISAEAGGMTCKPSGVYLNFQFGEDKLETMTPDDFFALAKTAASGFDPGLNITLSRFGVIKSADGQMMGTIALNPDGSLHQLNISRPVEEGEDKKEMEFFLSAADLLFAGKTKDSVRSAIKKKYASVKRGSETLNGDTSGTPCFQYDLWLAGESVSFNVTTYDTVTDAVGFVDGQKNEDYGRLFE